MEANVDEALKEADANNDGYITWVEYQEAIHHKQSHHDEPQTVPNSAPPAT